MLPCLQVNVFDQIRHLGKKGMSHRQITKKLRGVMPLKRVPKLKVNNRLFSFIAYIMSCNILLAN